ncbi:MAG: hypothetical protein ABIE84_02215 [bacterium]
MDASKINPLVVSVFPNLIDSIAKPAGKPDVFLSELENVFAAKTSLLSPHDILPGVLVPGEQLPNPTPFYPALNIEQKDPTAIG